MLVDSGCKEIISISAAGKTFEASIEIKGNTVFVIHNNNLLTLLRSFRRPERMLTINKLQLTRTPGALPDIRVEIEFSVKMQALTRHERVNNVNL